MTGSEGGAGGGSALAGRRILRGVGLSALGLWLVVSGMGATGARAQSLPADSPAAGAQEAAIPSVIAQFTTGIREREPIDQVSFVPNTVEKVYFFSELRDLTGQRVRHRWIHEGEILADVAFEVRGPRWRVWSSKRMLPGWLGDWTVEVVDEKGEVIAAESFSYLTPGGE